LQSISRSLATLEGDLGVELIARTTRRSAATEAGLAFYRRVGAALSEIEAAKLETSNRRSEPVGLLRITSSTVFAPLYVVPAVCAFLKSHRKVDIELDMSDGYVDLISQGFDLAIRIGELPDSSLKARRLADLRRVVFAAPAYFAKHGRPKVPGDSLQRPRLERPERRQAPHPRRLHKPTQVEALYVPSESFLRPAKPQERAKCQLMIIARCLPKSWRYTWPPI
jgi:DNA-binding transcriptional LysR family regulator